MKKTAVFFPCRVHRPGEWEKNDAFLTNNYATYLHQKVTPLQIGGVTFLFIQVCHPKENQSD